MTSAHRENLHSTSSEIKLSRRVLLTGSFIFAKAPASSRWPKKETLFQKKKLVQFTEDQIIDINQEKKACGVGLISPSNQLTNRGEKKKQLETNTDSQDEKNSTLNNQEKKRRKKRNKNEEQLTDSER